MEQTMRSTNKTKRTVVVANQAKSNWNGDIQQIDYWRKKIIKVALNRMLSLLSSGSRVRLMEGSGAL